MKRFLQSDVLATGLAMFSMFFGAGNVVFPLELGRIAGDKNIFAISGLLITAVGMPLLGLFSMVLFDGDYKAFFLRMGNLPGFCVICLIMALIGPLGATPRCIVLSYKTLMPYLPTVVSPVVFAAISCVLIFLFCYRQSKILDVLGYILSPLLLLSLTIIIVKGFLFSPSPAVVAASPSDLFLTGLTVGYSTMDLFASFFFSAVVLHTLKSSLGAQSFGDLKLLSKITLQASLVAATLLGGIYVGMSFVSSFTHYSYVPARDELISFIARSLLGQLGGVIASLAVSLACLTTAIALIISFVDFLQVEFFGQKFNYAYALTGSLVVTFFFALQGFDTIMGFIAPFLLVLYPAIIVLTVFNVVHKLFDVDIVKTPVYATAGISLLSYLGYLF